MSGICGVCEPEIRFDQSAIEEMTASLVSDPESSQEAITTTSVALGVASRWPGQQLSRIQGVQVAANTDLVNQRCLTEFLEKKGIETHDLSTADRLAWSYKLAGMDFLKLLSGAFALAIWDEAARRLLLITDRLGIKPLYWGTERRRLWFASRPGAIVGSWQKGSQPEPAAITQFLLFSTIPAPFSAFRGVERLLPGHFVVFEAGQCRINCYWDVEYQENLAHSEEYWAAHLRREMHQAVDRHLEGSLPRRTGAYLSGGTDSSSVVAFMAERHDPVPTFSIFFDDPQYSEVGFARTTSARFHTLHFEKAVTPEDALEAIPKIAAYYDEPFGNSSAIGGYYCAQLAKQNGVDTLLGGDGGDELFGGNARYATDKKFQLYQSIPSWVRHRVLEPAIKLLPASGRLSLPRSYVRRASIPNPDRMLSYSLFLSEDPASIFESDFLREAPANEWLKIARGHFGKCRASELNRLLYMDLKMTLTDNDLPKVSGTAEMAGVRVRYPMLDEHLVEFSSTIPSRLKLKGLEKRYIFKKAMKGVLPDTILYKKKHGFGVPLSSWLLNNPKLNSFMRDVLDDSRTRQRGIFRQSFIDELVSRHRTQHVKFYGEVIWYLLVLELWQRRHLTSTRGFALAH